MLNELSTYDFEVIIRSPSFKKLDIIIPDEPTTILSKVNKASN